MACPTYFPTIPSTAFTITAPIPTGIAIFQPIFMSWS